MSSWGYRVCAGCGQNLEADEYSRNQWRKPIGDSRCVVCVAEGVQRDQSGFETARTNNSTRIDVDVSRYFATGSFRYCSLGRYAGGQRTNQQCVAKWFKDSWRSELHIKRDLEAVEKALKIITQWNNAGFSDYFVRINVPEHWTISNKECLVEAFIEDFFKINSNTGWTTREDSDVIDMLQALSHYSYHVSSGQFVLCDLQGGIFRDGVILTDPVILSRDHRFGVTDLGPKGISTFFYHHECTQYCQDHWTEPRDQRDYYRCAKKTTMSFDH